MKMKLSIICLVILIVHTIAITTNNILMGTTLNAFPIYGSIFVVGACLVFAIAKIEKTIESPIPTLPEQKEIVVGETKIEEKVEQTPETKIEPKADPLKIETALDKKDEKAEAIAKYVLEKVNAGIDLKTIYAALIQSQYEAEYVRGIINEMIKQKIIVVKQPEPVKVKEEDDEEGDGDEEEDDDEEIEEPKPKKKKKKKSKKKKTKMIEVDGKEKEVEFLDDEDETDNTAEE